MNPRAKAVLYTIAWVLGAGVSAAVGIGAEAWSELASPQAALGLLGAMLSTLMAALTRSPSDAGPSGPR